MLSRSLILFLFFFFFFNDTATTEIYTLSLHDALPISLTGNGLPAGEIGRIGLSISRGTHGQRIYALIDTQQGGESRARWRDRKSTRLNSSHANISYAVFCLKKKKKKQRRRGARDDTQK